MRFGPRPPYDIEAARHRPEGGDAPDNWTFLKKFQSDGRAADFFHARERLSEVADRRDRLVRQVTRHPARRRQGRRQGRPAALCDKTTGAAL